MSSIKKNKILQTEIERMRYAVDIKILLQAMKDRQNTTQPKEPHEDITIHTDVSTNSLFKPI